MSSDLSYLNTEYAREKMIESYDQEAKAMKTGKNIIDEWHKHSKTAWFAVEDSDCLEKRIDEALHAARTEGEIAGAERMVEVVRRTATTV